MVRDADGKIKDAVADLVGSLLYWVQSEPLAEVQGTAAVNGDQICVISVPAGKTFVCCIAKCSSNVAAMVYIGHGTLAAMTILDFIDIQNVGLGGAITEGQSPLVVWKNTTAAAVNMIMYAPHTALGNVNNNDANHYFHGFIGGLLI